MGKLRKVVIISAVALLCFAPLLAYLNSFSRGSADKEAKDPVVSPRDLGKRTSQQKKKDNVVISIEKKAKLPAVSPKDHGTRPSQQTKKNSVAKGIAKEAKHLAVSPKDHETRPPQSTKKNNMVIKKEDKPDPKSEQDGRLHNIQSLLTSPVYPQILIYNRVPKCASATMLAVCRRMSDINRFSYNNMLETETSYRSWMGKMSLAKWMFQRPINTRHFFFQHMRYINFTSIGFWEPAWINVARQPVQRYISHYYYKKPLQTLEVCLETDVCKFKKGISKIPTQISYFCGYNRACSQGSKSEILQIAKGRVEKAYAVVGLKERFQDTLFILEHLLPRFFSHVTRINYENLNVRSSRPPISNETLAILRQKLDNDIDFYDFLEQRFFAQLAFVKGQQKSSKRN